MKSKRPKYGNKKVVADGITFGSGKEFDRFIQLKLMEKSGEISGLVVHPKFDLMVNGYLICQYEADFSYVRNGSELVVEDTKGIDKKRKFSTRTPEFILKKKLMKAGRGIDVQEI